MNKQEVLSQLRQAKNAHIRWRTYAQALLHLSDQQEDIQAKAPVAHTDCQFGQWYYNNIDQLGFLKSYQLIDPLHENLHRTYARIFEVMEASVEKNAILKLFTTKGRQFEKQKKAAMPLMKELENISQTLLKAIEVLESEINEMDEEKLAQL